jgi:hypothetical protein
MLQNRKTHVSDYSWLFTTAAYVKAWMTLATVVDDSLHLLKVTSAKLMSKPWNIF